MQLIIFLYLLHFAVKIYFQNEITFFPPVKLCVKNHNIFWPGVIHEGKKNLEFDKDSGV